MYLGEDIKKLGFGLMRLPRIGDEIDIEGDRYLRHLYRYEYAVSL